MRHRLAELEEELAAADRRGVAGRGRRLSAKREALLAQLPQCGLAGRPRRLGGTAERARVAVRKAIAQRLSPGSSRSTGLAPAVADTVSTGVACRVEPDPGSTRPLGLLGEPAAGPRP